MIRLSVMSNYGTSLSWSHTLSSLVERVDSIVYANLDGYNFVNVLLIHWTGPYAERLAVGQIHINAWKALPSEKELIRLI